MFDDVVLSFTHGGCRSLGQSGVFTPVSGVTVSVGHYNDVLTRRTKSVQVKFFIKSGHIEKFIHLCVVSGSISFFSKTSKVKKFGFTAYLLYTKNCLHRNSKVSVA